MNASYVRNHLGYLDVDTIVACVVTYFVMTVLKEEGCYLNGAQWREYVTPVVIRQVSYLFVFTAALK